jgi:hypothetical protein
MEGGLVGEVEEDGEVGGRDEGRGGSLLRGGVWLLWKKSDCKREQEKDARVVWALL